MELYVESRSFWANREDLKDKLEVVIKHYVEVFLNQKANEDDGGRNVTSIKAGDVWEDIYCLKSLIEELKEGEIK